eukprot:scaffold77328_cov22-Cyclotella_meneghiniana.AAC.3
MSQRATYIPSKQSQMLSRPVTHKIRRKYPSIATSIQSKVVSTDPAGNLLAVKRQDIEHYFLRKYNGRYCNVGNNSQWVGRYSTLVLQFTPHFIGQSEEDYERMVRLIVNNESFDTIKEHHIRSSRLANDLTRQHESTLRQQIATLRQLHRSVLERLTSKALDAKQLSNNPILNTDKDDGLIVDEMRPKRKRRERNRFIDESAKEERKKTVRKKKIHR